MLITIVVGIYWGKKKEARIATWYERLREGASADDVPLAVRRDVLNTTIRSTAETTFMWVLAGNILWLALLVLRAGSGIHRNRWCRWRVRRGDDLFCGGCALAAGDSRLFSSGSVEFSPRFSFACLGQIAHCLSADRYSTSGNSGQLNLAARPTSADCA